MKWSNGLITNINNLTRIKSRIIFLTIEEKQLNIGVYFNKINMWGNGL